MIYTTTINRASLRLRESRIVADLLLRNVDADQWNDAVVEQNALQLKSEQSILAISGLLRARLEPLGEDIWTIIRDGERDIATQAALAGAIKNSRLLGDFMDITIREQRALFATHLETRMWRDYIEGCRGRDPDLPHWSDATVNKLRSVVFSILAQAGYLADAGSLALQNVFVDAHLAACLRARGESYVLRCMEVTE